MLKENILVVFIRMLICTITAFSFSLIEPSLYILSTVGLAFFFYYCVSFFARMGGGLPIKEVILIIAFLQWIVAPILSYHVFTKSDFYYMSVPEIAYMDFVVPTTIFFSLGLTIAFKKLDIRSINFDLYSNEYFEKRGKIILAIGYTSLIILPFAPASLAYLFLLISYSTIVGGFYILKSNIKTKFLWLALGITPILLQGINTAVFHDTFIWFGYTIIIYSFLNKSNIIAKSTIIISSLTLILLINFVKKDYREIIWSEDLNLSQLNNNDPNNSNQNKSSTSTLINLMGEKTKTGINKDGYQEFIDRLNQGWIISRIMYVVPEYEPYANGETIKDGIYAAILPRVLAPNKTMAGGRQNFERFTGLQLINVSMNLGIIGEAYANYGEQGGLIFMFFYGLFFNLVFVFIFSKAEKKPELILWIPFIFFYTVKAEDDFAGVFNQFVKASIVAALLNFMLPKHYQTKIIEKSVNEN